MTTTCTGAFDGSFEVQGISAPATAGNIALDVDGYYDWDPAFVPGGNLGAFVPENSSETAKLNVLSPKDLLQVHQHRSEDHLQGMVERTDQDDEADVDRKEVAAVRS